MPNPGIEILVEAHSRIGATIYKGSGAERRKSNLYGFTKRLNGLLDHTGRDYPPRLLVDWDPPDNDLGQDQNIEESGPRQARINGLIWFPFSRIAFEQLRLSLFDSRNPLYCKPPFEFRQELSKRLFGALRRFI